MSAYIVSKDDMNAALRVLYASGEAQAFGFADASQLGRHLFAMNIAAVSARYGGEDVNSLPGPAEDVSGYPTEYEASDVTGEATADTWREGDEAVSSLAYQCAEGDIPETWPAYALLNAARDRIRPRARAIIAKAAAEHERNRPSARWVETKEAAKLLRCQLRKRFPGVKFSVRSDRYSMGSHIELSWTDGPSKREVEAIARTYSGTRFESRDDSTYTVQSWLFPDGRTAEAGYDEPAPEPGAERVRFSGSLPSCSREISPEFEAKCAAAWDKLTGEEQCKLLNDFTFPRWPEDRPGYRLASFIPAP
jgi:Large polyvalent protein associated domain 29